MGFATFSNTATLACMSSCGNPLEVGGVEQTCQVGQSFFGEQTQICIMPSACACGLMLRQATCCMRPGFNISHIYTELSAGRLSSTEEFAEVRPLPFFKLRVPTPESGPKVNKCSCYSLWPATIWSCQITVQRESTASSSEGKMTSTCPAAAL